MTAIEQTRAATAAPTRRRAQVWYVALACLVAVSYACGSTAARVAYDGGSNALSVSTGRTVTATAVLLALLLAWRVPLRLTRRERTASLIIGVLLAGYAFCLYKSFEYIPVALGVLTFYTYPLLIALIAWATGQGRPTPRMAAALAVAFGGLVLALGIAGAGLDIRGILVAGLGGFGFALLLVATGRLFPGGDSRPRTLHMLASASLSYLVVCAVTGHFAWPQTSAGWIGFAASTGFYCVAIVGLFVAAGALGPVKTALILNLEPVSSVVLGFLVLDQRLTPLQLVGVALVVGAILFARSSSPGQAKR